MPIALQWTVSEAAEYLLEEISEAAAARVPTPPVAVIVIVRVVAFPTGSDGNVFRRYDLFVVLLDLVPAALQGERDPLFVAVDIAEGLDLPSLPTQAVKYVT